MRINQVIYESQKVSDINSKESYNKPEQNDKNEEIEIYNKIFKEFLNTSSVYDKGANYDLAFKGPVKNFEKLIKGL